MIRRRAIIHGVHLCASTDGGTSRVNNPQAAERLISLSFCISGWKFHLRLRVRGWVKASVVGTVVCKVGEVGISSGLNVIIAVVLDKELPR